MNFFRFSWIMVWLLTSAIQAVQFVGAGQFAVQQQVGDFQETALFGQLLDGVAAIAQDPPVAIQIGDGALAGGRIQKCGVVAQQAEIVRVRS